MFILRSFLFKISLKKIWNCLNSLIYYTTDIYTSSTFTWISNKAEKRNLDPMLFLPWQNALKTRIVPFSLTVSSTVYPLSPSFLTKAYTELPLLEWIGKECRKWKQANRWTEVITNISLLTKLLAVNGLIKDQSQCCSVKKEILSIYFFRFDGCTLVQCLHGLQYDESKRPCVA